MNNEEENFEILEACKVILNLWFQYGYRKHDYFSPGFVMKSITLNMRHDFMSAGEAATEFLEKHGCVVENGDCAVLTKKGLELMELEDFYLPWEQRGKNLDWKK